MARKHFVIGLTGRSGSGKSTAAGIFRDDYGFTVIDVDAVGHDILEENRLGVIAIFGSGILNEKGEIDRGFLGDIVFSDPGKLAALNSLLHSGMKKRITRLISGLSNKLVVLDAALLFEIKLDELCDFILSVEAPDSEIIDRLKKCRKWTRDKASNVLKSQSGMESRRQEIDYILFNNADEEKLRRQIEFFILTVL